MTSTEPTVPHAELPQVPISHHGNTDSTSISITQDSQKAVCKEGAAAFSSSDPGSAESSHLASLNGLEDNTEDSLVFKVPSNIEQGKIDSTENDFVISSSFSLEKTADAETARPANAGQATNANNAAPEKRQTYERPTALSQLSRFLQGAVAESNCIYGSGEPSDKEDVHDKCTSGVSACEPRAQNDTSSEPIDFQITDIRSTADKRATGGNELDTEAPCLERQDIVTRSDNDIHVTSGGMDGILDSHHSKEGEYIMINSDMDDDDDDENLGLASVKTEPPDLYPYYEEIRRGSAGALDLSVVKVEPPDATPLSDSQAVSSLEPGEVVYEQCSSCTFSATSAVELARHEHSHATPRDCDMRFVCKAKGCPFSTNDGSEFACHAGGHLGQRIPRVYRCSYCKLETTEVTQAEDHQEEQHPNMEYLIEMVQVKPVNPNWVCKVCKNKYFSQRMYLIVHLYKKHNLTADELTNIKREVDAEHEGTGPEKTAPPAISPSTLDENVESFPTSNDGASPSRSQEEMETDSPDIDIKQEPEDEELMRQAYQNLNFERDVRDRNMEEQGNQEYISMSLDDEDENFMDFIHTSPRKENSHKFECLFCSEEFPIIQLFVRHLKGHNFPNPHRIPLYRCGNCHWHSSVEHLMQKHHDTKHSHGTLRVETGFIEICGTEAQVLFENSGPRCESMKNMGSRKPSPMKRTLPFSDTLATMARNEHEESAGPSKRRRTEKPACRCCADDTSGNHVHQADENDQNSEDLGMIERHHCDYCDFSSNSTREFHFHMRTHMMSSAGGDHGDLDENVGILGQILQADSLDAYKDDRESSLHRRERGQSLDPSPKSRGKAIPEEFSEYIARIDNGQLFRCNVCQYQSNIAHNVKRHILAIHLNCYPYTCGYCPYKSVNEDGTRRHWSRKHPGLPYKINHKEMADIPPLKVPELPSTTPESVRVDDYIVIAKDDKGMHKCKFCTFKNKMLYKVQRHVCALHLKIHPFHCGYCSYRSVNGCDVKGHCLKKHPEKPVNVVDIRTDGNMSVLRTGAVPHKRENDPKSVTKKGSSVKEAAKPPIKLKIKMEPRPAVSTDDGGDNVDKDADDGDDEDDDDDDDIDATPTRMYTSISKYSVADDYILKGTGRLPYKCKCCNYASTRCYLVRQHVHAIHLQLRPFLCPYCPYKAVKPAMVRLHCSQKHAHLPVKVKFKKPDPLKPAAPESNRQFRCYLCGYETDVRTNMLEHLERKMGYKPYQCTKCDLGSIRKGRVLHHFNSAHPEVTNCKVKYRYTPDEAKMTNVLNMLKKCNVTLTSKNSLPEEWLDDENSEGSPSVKLEPLTDKDLELGDDSPSQDWNDVRGDHEKEDAGCRYRCPRCGYATNTWSNIWVHCQREVEYKPYKCAGCSYSASASSHIIRHYKAKHDAYVNIKDMCRFVPNKKRLADAQSLLEESRLKYGKNSQSLIEDEQENALAESGWTDLTHDSEEEAKFENARKYFKCVHCKFRTVYKYAMMGHIMRELNYKPYRCSACNYHAIKKASVQCHFQNVHPKLKFRYIHLPNQKKVSEVARLLRRTEVKAGEEVKESPVSNVKSPVVAVSKPTPVYTRVPKAGSGLMTKPPPSLQKRYKHLHQYRCRCGYQTWSNGNMYQHLQWELDYRPYKCGYCDYRAMNPAVLTRSHIKSRHPNFPYKYDHIRDDAKKALLKQRLQECCVGGPVPDKVKVKRSPSVDSRSTVSSTDSKVSKKSQDQGKGAVGLKLGKMRVMLRDKKEITMYNCTKCDYQTKHLCDITYHIKRHLGLKPFVCTECGWREVKPCIVLKHFKKHHPDVQRHTKYHFLPNQKKMAEARRLVEQAKADATNRTSPSKEISRVVLNTPKYPMPRDKNPVKQVETPSTESKGECYYKCTKCGLTSKSVSDMSYHIQREMGYKPYLCTECDFREVKPHVVVSHFKKVHSNKTRSDQYYFLPNEEKVEEVKRLLEKSKMWCKTTSSTSVPTGETKPVQVKTESSAAGTAVSSAKAAKSGTRKADYYRCPTCGRQTPYISDMSYHIQREINYKPYVCTVCGFREVKPYMVVIHFKKVHPKVHGQPKYNFFPNPQRVAEVKRILEQSKVYSDQTESASVSDTQDNERVENQSPKQDVAMSTKRWKNSVDVSKEDHYRCSMCGYETKHNSDMSVHLKREIGYRPFQCNICNFSELKPSKMLSHFRIHHSGVSGIHNKYTYTPDDKKLDEVRRLMQECKVYSAAKRRSRESDTVSPSPTAPIPKLLKTPEVKLEKLYNAETYTCTQCGYQSKDKNYMSCHIKRELDYKPYLCTQCDFRAAKPFSIKQHFRKSHPKKGWCEKYTFLPDRSVLEEVEKRLREAAGTQKALDLTIKAKEPIKTESPTSYFGQTIRKTRSNTYSDILINTMDEDDPLDDWSDIDIDVDDSALFVEDTATPDEDGDTASLVTTEVEHELVHRGLFWFVTRQLNVKSFRCGYCSHAALYPIEIIQHKIQRHPNMPLKMTKLSKKAHRAQVRKMWREACKLKEKFEGHIQPSAKPSEIFSMDMGTRGMVGCKDCGYATTRKRTMMCHLLRHCEDDIRLECRECGFRTKFRSKMKNHVSLLHPGTVGGYRRLGAVPRQKYLGNLWDSLVEVAPCSVSIYAGYTGPDRLEALMVGGNSNETSVSNEQAATELQLPREPDEAVVDIMHQPVACQAGTLEETNQALDSAETEKAIAGFNEEAKSLVDEGNREMGEEGHLESIAEQNFSTVDEFNLGTVDEQDIGVIDEQDLESIYEQDQGTGHEQDLETVDEQDPGAVDEQDLAANHDQDSETVHKQNLGGSDELNLGTVDELDIIRTGKEEEPGTVDEQYPGTVDEQYPGTVDEQYPDTVDEQYPGTVDEQYPGTVDEQYPGTVDEQYPGTVDEQYPGTVDEQCTDINTVNELHQRTVGEDKTGTGEDLGTVTEEDVRSGGGDDLGSEDETKFVGKKVDTDDEDHEILGEDESGNAVEEEMETSGDRAGSSRQSYGENISEGGEGFKETDAGDISDGGEDLKETDAENIGEGGEGFKETDAGDINDRVEGIKETDSENISDGGEDLKETDAENIGDGVGGFKETDVESISDRGEGFKEADAGNISDRGADFEEGDAGNFSDRGESFKETDAENISDRVEGFKEADTGNISDGGEGTGKTVDKSSDIDEKLMESISEECFTDSIGNTNADSVTQENNRLKSTESVECNKSGIEQPSATGSHSGYMLPQPSFDVGPSSIGDSNSDNGIVHHSVDNYLDCDNTWTSRLEGAGEGIGFTNALSSTHTNLANKTDCDITGDRHEELVCSSSQEINSENLPGELATVVGTESSTTGENSENMDSATSTGDIPGTVDSSEYPRVDDTTIASKHSGVDDILDALRASSQGEEDSTEVTSEDEALLDEGSDCDLDTVDSDVDVLDADDLGMIDGPGSESKVPEARHMDIPTKELLKDDEADDEVTS